MTPNKILQRAIDALEALTNDALSRADDDAVRKLQELAYNWSELAARERRERSEQKVEAKAVKRRGDRETP